MLIRELLRERFTDQSIVLLGFGREGQSSYSLLRSVFPGKPLAIADHNESVRENPVLKHDEHIHFITGPDYLSKLSGYDVIFRSPGIPVWKLVSGSGTGTPEISEDDDNLLIPREKITSQTNLFLACYSRQVIGVTGTKGKSTTSTLIHHILKTAGRDVLLAGNIGNPVFHFIDLISDQTIIVLELSSHQLEFLSASPHIAIMLNLYQEHLDAYESYEAYQLAKTNLVKFQHPGDIFIFNADDPLVLGKVAPYTGQRRCLPFTLSEPPARGSGIRNGTVYFSDEGEEIPVWNIHQDRFLRGDHNLKNILAAINVAMCLGIDTELIDDGIATFKGLEHRLEYAGEFRGIHFYNDSIATIPEACMEAVKAVPHVDTLVAGGFDRGIDYSGLAEFLTRSEVRNLILIGAAGRRIMEHLTIVGYPGKKLFFINRFDDFVAIAFRETRPGYACLLSPAAASYDEFKNFEERGKRFRELIRS